MIRNKVFIIHKVDSLDARSFYKEARSLKNADYEISLLGLYNKNEIIDGIKLVGFKVPKGRLARFFTTNYAIFKYALKAKADIYHFHDLDFIPWAILLKIITLKKVIYDIHEAHPEFMLLKTYLPRLLRKFMYVLVYIVEHISVMFFDAIIPNDNYISKGFNHRRNVVLFNFPTLDFFGNNEFIPWQNREYDLFYHGSVPKYHMELMMNIAEKLNSENIGNRWGIIMNSFAPRDWIISEIKKRGLEGNFIFLPYTEYLNIYNYLANARIGIIPLPPFKKFMKNIAVKMFEFMGAGMPIVLSDLPPSRQFIKSKNCGFAVEPDNVDEYAEAIKKLLRDGQRSLSMGSNGKKIVFEICNWSIEEKKMLQLYSELIQ